MLFRSIDPPAVTERAGLCGAGVPNIVMAEPNDQFDSPWKEIVEEYFAEFMEFFFPDAHADID